MKTRKSWREKLDNPKLPKVVEIPPRMQKRFGTGTMLIPHAMDIVDLIRRVPSGELITVSNLRESLAAKFLADTTCPLVTGFFVRLAAEAAEEDARDGARDITPYWRVVRDDGSLNPKLPGGVERQAAKLRAEGHRIVAGSGKRPPRVALEQREAMSDRLRPVRAVRSKARSARSRRASS